MSAIEPLTPEIRDELLAFGTATLYEAGGRDLDLDPGIRSAFTGAKVCGPARTVRTGEADNLALHHAVTERGSNLVDGRVLVVDGHSAACGYWGEVLTVAAQAAGIGGLVIDGGVRDTEQLAALGFGTFSRHIAIARTAKSDQGDIGAAVVVGGRRIADGDIVVGDADGVLAIPVAELDSTLEASRERLAKELDFMERLGAGELTVDLYGLSPRVHTKR